MSAPGRAARMGAARRTTGFGGRGGSMTERGEEQGAGAGTAPQQEPQEPKDRRVRLLSDALVDQIAAGEVVERPASVVKELVENALDAGAQRIRVEVRDGGAAFIGVTDDGLGMSPDDVRMALMRHATSKLREQGDLERIHSFGFRGEALPSIASVSRLRILSRERDADEGFELRVEGGEHVRESAAGGPVGTRVEVADLFAPVPARRKFLKKPGTEWSHIADWLSRLALSLPGVHFEIQRDDRPASVWPACETTRDRIAQVLPARDAECLVEVEREDATGHLHAFASPPTHHRANGEGLYLYVNGRPVRDKLLRSAVLAAYRDILPRGRFPVAVVFLTVPPETVDVNVHPAKWEVRFADPQAVHQLVRRAVREAMSERAWLAGEAPGPAPVTPSAGGTPPLAPRESAAAHAPTASSSTPARPATTDWIFAREAAERLGEAGADPGDVASAPVGSASGETTTAAPVTAPLPVDVRGERRPFRFGELQRLGQIKASYIALEGPGGLVLVDQHAAHERVLYERLRATWLEAGVERQGLLVPVNVELPALQIDALLEGLAAVEQLGFEIEPFGESAVVVRAVPALLTDRDPEGLVRELAEELERSPLDAPGEGDRIRLLRAVDRVFATLACHSARRFGDRLGPSEQEAILHALDEVPWAPSCPHGRPVAIAFDWPDIERRFDRR